MFLILFSYLIYFHLCYLNAPVQDELDELVLQVCHTGVEAVCHPVEVCRAVGGEVLDEAPVPDHGEEGVDVGGEVHVQHQVVLHLLQQLQTLAVP